MPLGSKGGEEVAVRRGMEGGRSLEMSGSFPLGKYFLLNAAVRELSAGAVRAVVMDANGIGRGFISTESLCAY